PGAHELRGDGALAGARRARDADAAGVSETRVQRAREHVEASAMIFDNGDGARQSSWLLAVEVDQQPIKCANARVVGGRAHPASPPARAGLPALSDLSASGAGSSCSSLISPTSSSN